MLKRIFKYSIGSVLPALLLLSGCASQPTASIDNVEKMNPVTREAHDQVLEILQARAQGRQPASVADVTGAKVTDLNRIRPGKFEVYVFPKISNQNVKEAGRVSEVLGAPQVFEVSTIAESPCQAFVRGPLFKNLNPAGAFASQELAENPSRRCAIVQITSRKLRTVNRALLKRDDIISVRVFIDDAYRLHATDYTIVKDRGQIIDTRVKNDPRSASFSGLTLFPMDFPGENFKNRPADPAALLSRRVDATSVDQIRRRHNRGFVLQSCQGNLSEGKDQFGQPLTIGWCKGLPWPQFMENMRFLAITQPLAVR